MDGIDEILRAEKDAERIRRETAEAVGAILGSAEGYRTTALEEARREGEEEAQRLLALAEERAKARREELSVIANVKNEELQAKAAERMAKAAGWLAERIAEV